MNAKPRHGLTEHAADAAVEQACRMLRLPTIRTQFPDLAQAAAREQMSYRAFLAELLIAATTAPAAAPNGGSRPPGSRARSRCEPSTSTPTPASTLPSSTPSPPATGSRRACRCA